MRRAALTLIAMLLAGSVAVLADDPPKSDATETSTTTKI